MEHVVLQKQYYDYFRMYVQDKCRYDNVVRILLYNNNVIKRVRTNMFFFEPRLRLPSNGMRLYFPSTPLGRVQFRSKSNVFFFVLSNASNAMYLRPRRVDSFRHVVPMSYQISGGAVACVAGRVWRGPRPHSPCRTFVSSTTAPTADTVYIESVRQTAAACAFPAKTSHVTRCYRRVKRSRARVPWS